MNKKGFTLLELMVVVAILGILSSLSISRYNSNKAKAHQAEIKLALSSIYSLEKAFCSEYAAYIADFSAIGYAPEGVRRFYTVGFQAATATGNVTGYAGSAGTYYYPRTTPLPGGDSTDGCIAPCGGGMDSAGAWAACVSAWGNPSAATVNPLTFNVYGMGHINYFGTCSNGDIWHIDNNKNLSMQQSGI